METKSSGVLADGSDRVIIDPNPPVIEAEIEHGIEIPTEPIAEVVTPEETVVEPEPVFYNDIEQDAFTQELLYQGESGLALHLQIKSDNFINKDGSLTADTIAKAKAHGMTDTDINNHQNSILKQINTFRDEAFAATGMPVGYIGSVMDWVRATFTESEMKIFESDCVKDLTGSLQSVERYYQHVTSGGAR